MQLNHGTLKCTCTRHATANVAATRIVAFELHQSWYKAGIKFPTPAQLAQQKSKYQELSRDAAQQVGKSQDSYLLLARK